MIFRPEDADLLAGYPEGRLSAIGFDVQQQADYEEMGETRKEITGYGCQFFS